MRQPTYNRLWHTIEYAMITIQNYGMTQKIIRASHENTRQNDMSVLARHQIPSMYSTVIAIKDRMMVVKHHNDLILCSWRRLVNNLDTSNICIKGHMLLSKSCDVMGQKHMTPTLKIDTICDSLPSQTMIHRIHTFRERNSPWNE